jgi:YcxB-like protein
MRSVTKWSDVLVLNCWLNLRSKFNWFVSIAIGALIAASIVSPRLQHEGQSLGMAVQLFFAMFATLLLFIWLIGFLVILLIAGVQLSRKGCIGPKVFVIGRDAFTEDDTKRVTVVPWSEIRSVDKTRGHIFVRISRWKYMLLSARDFQNEHQFAQYYADLVKAKHETRQG